MNILPIILLTLSALSSAEQSSKLAVATNENFGELLATQLSSEITDPKKHKPMLLALVSRDAPGTLEFSREFNKLADTVHRQFRLVMADCHHEHDICEPFRPEHFPMMFLFKEGKVH